MLGKKFNHTSASKKARLRHCGCMQRTGLRLGLEAGRKESCHPIQHPIWEMLMGERADRTGSDLNTQLAYIPWDLGEASLPHLSTPHHAFCSCPSYHTTEC